MGEKIMFLCSETMLRCVFMQSVQKSLFSSTVPGSSIPTQGARNFLIPFRYVLK